ncbi:hypothetical protein MUK42_19496, partial [Musa troglodytarum]
MEVPSASRPSQLESLVLWVQTNYAEPLDSLKQSLRIAYVVFAFCSALFLGALKALVVGPVAALLLILGNVGHSCCPARPRYRKRKISHSAEFSVGASSVRGVKAGYGSSGAPAMLVPSLAPSRSVRETIQEVKMVQ